MEGMASVILHNPKEVNLNDPMESISPDPMDAVRTLIFESGLVDLRIFIKRGDAWKIGELLTEAGKELQYWGALTHSK